MRLRYVGWLLAAGFLVASNAQAGTARPVLITVDDLPIAADELHRDPAEREQITRDLLAVLAKHHIRAVGLVTGKHHPTERDASLLARWVEAGHELGNHSFAHLNYSETEPSAYIADVEQERVWLDSFLKARGQKLRFFRFPFLNEGNTPEKLQAMRDYLRGSGQRNLPVTIDNQDWSFEEPWVQAQRAHDTEALRIVAEDYQAALRLHTQVFERRGEKLFGHPTPDILLLHATAVGAAQWDTLFTWLEKTGHRFATADEVLADPAYAEAQSYVGEDGPSLWERIRLDRRPSEVRAALKALLDQQTQAWNRGDLAAFVSGYAPDATFVSPTGITQGRDAVLARYKAKYPNQKAMGRLSLELMELRIAEGEEYTFFGDTVASHAHGASIVGRWRLEYPDKPAASGTTVLVFRRRGSGWEIVQDASM